MVISAKSFRRYSQRAGTQAVACAVCFGDPNSALSKGVVVGVLLLIAVIATVLIGIVIVGLSWLRRARQINKKS